VWLWYRNSAPIAPAAQDPPARSRFTVALGMVAVAGIAGLARAVLVVGAPVSRGVADRFLLVFGVTSLALAFWEIVLYCVLVSAQQVRTLT